MPSSFTEDPFEILGRADDRTWPETADPLGDAITAFNENSPDPLVSLLQSKDPLIVKRGLFVFGELGRKCAVVMGECVAANTERLIAVRRRVQGNQAGRRKFRDGHR